MQDAVIAKNNILSYSLVLFEELFSNIDFDCDFEKKGLLTLFTDPAYFEKYAKTNALLKQYELSGSSLTADQTRKLEPAVNSKVVGSWLNPHDWHLRPETLMSAWKQDLVSKGLIIEEYNSLIDFEIENRTVKRVVTTKGTFSADAFILTTGAWAADLNRQLDFKLPVQPGKGYSITMERPESAPAIPCLLYERNMVATPWGSGFRLGGTMEFSGFNKVLNKKRLMKLISGAKQYLKTDIEQPIVEEWTGLRPMTCDDLPIIGHAPRTDNLFLATGHGMLGLTMATGTGKMVADLVLNNKPQINPEPFSPMRFN